MNKTASCLIAGGKRNEQRPQVKEVKRVGNVASQGISVPGRENWYKKKQRRAHTWHASTKAGSGVVGVEGARGTRGQEVES